MATYICLFVALTALAGGAWAAYPCDTAADWFAVYNGCKSMIRHTSGDGIKNKHDSLCTDTIDPFVSCMEVAFVSCDAPFRAKVTDWMAEYKARVCNADITADGIIYLTHTFECLFNESDCTCEPPVDMCNYWSTYEEVKVCYDRLYDTELFTVSLASKTIEWAQPLLKRYMKSALRCIRHRIDFRDTHCDEVSRMALVWYHLYAMMPPGVDLTYADARARWNLDTGVGPRSTVAAFGDPHIQGYNQNKAITCSSPGLTTMVENSVCKIEAYNTFASPDNEATSMTEIEITFLNGTTGEILATYSAIGGNLPQTFVGGRDLIDVDGGELSVSTWKQDYVTIKHVPASIVIIIGRYGTMYPILSARMPDALLDISFGLFIEPCEDTIDISPNRRKRASTECETGCASAVDSNFYDTCVYDCDVTGDLNLATAGDLSVVEVELLSMDIELANGAAMMTSGVAMMTSLVLYATSRLL